MPNDESTLHVLHNKLARDNSRYVLKVSFVIFITSKINITFTDTIDIAILFKTI